MSKLIDAIVNRYSARHLDASKKISNEDLESIIEAGRKAPSGFGSEPWLFYVLDGDLSKLSEATYGQAHVPNASKVIAIVTYKKALVDQTPDVLRNKFKANGYPEEQIERAMTMMNNLDLDAYFHEQAAFAATQMAVQATAIGIGSVIMSGFNPQAVADILEIDSNLYDVSLLITLGYSTEKSVKVRKIRDYDEVVKKVTI